MKIDTTVLLKTLKGTILKDDFEPNKDLTLGIALGNIFSTGHSVVERFSAYKAYKFATDFFEKESVEINDADFDDIVEFLDKEKGYPPILTGQIVMLLKDIKEKNRLERQNSAK